MSVMADRPRVRPTPARVSCHSSPPVPREDLLDNPHGFSFLLQVLKALLPPVALILAVLGSILAGIATPTEAAAVGAIGATLLAGRRLDEARSGPILAGAGALVLLIPVTALFDLRVARDTIPATDQAAIWLAYVLCALVAWGVWTSLRRCWSDEIVQSVMRSTTTISSMVFVILIGAGVFSLVFRGLGGDEMVHDILSAMPGGVVGAMIVVMLVMFVLGFFLDFIEITFVVVPIVAPVLLKMDIDPVWLGVMMAMNLQTSFLTPPFGFALFYLRGVAPPSVSTMQIYRGVAPYVLIQLVGLALLASFPELATWLPEVIFG